MKQARQLLVQYLSAARVMQIASADNNVPWICNVYYVVDNQLNIYWLSYPDRKHSRDIAVNPHMALCVAVKQDVPVIGVQAIGTGEVVDRAVLVAKVLPLYIQKYGLGKQFLQNFRRHNNKHMLYRFVPKKFMLFDELNFGMDNVQEIIPS